MSESGQRLPHPLYHALHRRHTPNPAESEYDIDRGSQKPNSPPPEQYPQDLTEVQLRQLYEQEEVERFICLFSAHVTEVRLPQECTDSEHVESAETDERESLGHFTETAPSLPPADPSISEFIAYNYVLPHLPSAARVPPTFSLKRLRLTTQRLYLAIFPPYQAFLLGLAHLALWKDSRRSLKRCIVFWVLWFYDLLLPALVFCILLGLLQRRLLPYPTLQELQERRQETAQALKFGEIVQERLSVTTLGPVEMWRLFKLYKLGVKEKAKDTGMSATNSKRPESMPANSADPSSDIIESRDEEDLKRDLLYLLETMADLLERIKNIYTWRRPHVSRRYAMFLLVVCFFTLTLPAQYVAKFVYWFAGMLFWHVPPVIAALPRHDRARVPLLFSDAPTDADYAIDLITKRIATGQDVRMASRRANQPYHTFGASTDSLISVSDGTSCEVRPSDHDGINWKKWSERLAQGKSLVEERRQLLSSRVVRNQVSGETSASQPAVENAQVFMAQHASSPGLIRLTSATLSFTPITASRARFVISRDRLRGVKKSGLMKGISVTWVPAESVDGKEREEKFHWVSDRDELFARLLGPDGGRWMRV